MQITGILGAWIVVNDTVDQRIIDYDVTKSYGSRQLTTKDAKWNLEWCSHPWMDIEKKEFVCVGQFDDEDILLQLNTFIAMEQFSFYRHGVLDLAVCDNGKSGHFSRCFIKEYFKEIDIKGINVNRFRNDADIDTQQMKLCTSYVTKL